MYEGTWAGESGSKDRLGTPKCSDTEDSEATDPTETARCFPFLVPISPGGATFGRCSTFFCTMPLGGAERSRGAS